jgi:hypothetical protein
MRAIIIPDPLEIKIRYLTSENIPYVIWSDKSISADPIPGLTHMGHVFVNLVQVADPPTSLHIANGSTLEYDANTYTVTETITYDEDPNMKTVARSRINDWSTGKQNSGFTFANVAYQSDPTSRSTIEGAVSMALIATMSNSTYSVSWTATDNTQHEMDANTVIQFGVAAATAFQTWHATGLALKANVESANTANAIQTILDSVGA